VAAAVSHVKVLCGYCGRKLGEVSTAPHGLTYRPAAGQGGTASSPAGMFCPDHGWPDLATAAFRRKLTQAGETGKATTQTAKMMPRPPAPEL
jgi:hypothetical protein